MNKLLSIIVPIYNVEHYLERQLDSIRNQTYKNFQCLLVNDGSTDNSELICKKFIQSDSRFVLINQENQGVSAARNKGLSYAKGDYVAFADADDIIEPRMYELLMNAAEQYDVDVASCLESAEEVYSPNDDGHNYDFRIIEHPIKEYYDDTLGGMKSKVYRYSFIKDIKFDETISYNEDELFSVIYYNKLDKMALCDARLYHYMMYDSGGIRLTQKKGDYKFYGGAVRANLKMKNIMESTGDSNLIKCAWDKYGRSVFALFRLAIQLRDKQEYYRLKKKYKKDIEIFLDSFDKGFMKKMTFYTYYYNYYVASVFHYYFRFSSR